MNYVKVFSDNDFGDEIAEFKPIECEVSLQSRVSDAPIESGRKSLDNKVLDPIVIKMIGKVNAFLDDGIKAVAQIKKMYADREYNFYSVTCKDGAFNNLILQNAPHKETSDSFDVVIYTLEFKEALIVQGSTKSTKDPSNNNYNSSGYKEPVEIFDQDYQDYLDFFAED